jgi:hypothetical protein
MSNRKQRGVDYTYVGTGADNSHAPVRAAYEAVGFDRTVPSVLCHRKL